MNRATTLPADVAPTVRPGYVRGHLSAGLSVPAAPGTPLAWLAAAAMALIAAPDSDEVMVGAVGAAGTAGAADAGLVALRSAVGPGIRLDDLLSSASRDGARLGGDRDDEPRMLVAAGIGWAEAQRVALELRDCDCVFLLNDAADGWLLECDYDADRYTEPAMRWHLDRLETLLLLLAEEPDTPLADVVVAAEPVAAPRDWDEIPYVAPRTPTERKLAAIWAEVLEVPRVGADDDFFAVGGHSILAAMALSRIRAAFEVEVHFDELFTAPTLAACAKVVERAAAGPARPLTGASGPAVASLEQERLWFLEQWRPGTALYNVPLVLELTGPVDPGRLGEALQRVADRHPALRTAFESVDGRPRPLTRDAEVPWRREEADDRAHAWRLVREHVAEPFDLSVPPLVRGGLVSFAADRHLLYLCIHHLAVDGWSLGHLLDDLGTAYRGLPLPPPDEFGYADYAAWQRGRPVADDLRWWRSYLAGLPPVLELPGDRPRPAVQSFLGGTGRRVLPPDLAAALADFARSRSATVFDVALSAFALLLRRWTGRSDLPIATPVAARPLPELEPLVGFFVNTLVVRADVSGDPSFAQLVERVRHSATAALGHQELPFSLLVEALQPERALSHAPVVQVAFAHYRPSHHDWELADGLAARLRQADTGTAKFDLMFTLHEAPGEMLLEVEYAADLLDAATADRLADQWLELVRGLLAGPGEPVSRIGVLPPGQRRRLTSWARAADEQASWDRVTDAGATIPELVARQVADRGDAVAVSAGRVQLTYAELWARSGALAARLGPRRGELVGLACHRGADLVVAMLAILRTGAAYVPFDSSYPAARLSFMMEDTGVGTLVGHRDLLAALPRTGTETIAIDGDLSPATGPEVPIRPEDAAYVIYTSGSTGRPKGVVVPHRGVVRLVHGADYVPLDTTTVLAQVSNASFDAITFEVWGALANGGRVVVVPPATVLAPSALTELLRAEHVTTLFLTTSLFNAVTTEEPGAFATVDHLCVGGEALDVARVGEVLRGGRGPRTLYDAYGPTEVTTFSVCQPLAEPPTTRGPIGRPISGTTAYVVDLDTGDLAPEGVPGELWLGGPGVAWGYWRRPGATAGAFVADPFSVEPGRRLYRTGDLARWTPAGTLEYLGRIDRQLKIRGFRVEPGEVELALSALPGVRACAVVARNPQDAPVELIAYLQPAGGAGLTSGAVREALARELPDHLVPAHVILVDRIPFGPNGKVETSSLPVPEEGRAETEAVAPAGPVEELLAEIWAEVLGLERLGATDDFFELGGHSLHAVKVTTRAERALRTSMSVRDLFRHKTVRRLAAALREADPDRLDRIAAIVLQVRHARVGAEEEIADAH
ncbi:non-ribosomal peptide synthetase [Nonomuraea sp. C10]|uniref:non-ribosomal peptide synthetase n=1 Tax=Nonomuraea sp. C10 TaxID=2600577 RepID=UPI0011CE0915|nr:non-ribosomal peptide synthetase [Nonomuraea sp. C10]TXK39557.1 amino acid adenylation domain-containing protein [Nonomuraea sp. C10]